MQTALFVPRIAALGHEVVISAPFSFGGSPLEWEGFPVLPAVRDQFGNDVLLANYQYHDCDLLITLCDPFGLQACAKDLAQLNTAIWFPVDCDPLGIGDWVTLRDSQATPVAMSRFGERVLRDRKTEPLYVPHGVDTRMFCPGDPSVYREGAGIAPDAFVIGVCAMNRDPLRKGIAEQMMAFAQFRARHPGAVMAMHTAPVASPGLNLMSLAAQLGITEAVRFPDSYALAAGLVTRQQLATWYQGLDVLSNCAYGEGFGLPVLEAQACGVPVIVTDCTALTELCGTGWLVSGTPFWAADHDAFRVRPDVADIAAAYEAAWQAREDGVMPREEAREFAARFDADQVALQSWKPVLETLGERAGT